MLRCDEALKIFISRTFEALQLPLGASVDVVTFYELPIFQGRQVHSSSAGRRKSLAFPEARNILFLNYIR
jgi:hypothetical protein